MSALSRSCIQLLILPYSDVLADGNGDSIML